jgi:hypothetical protein
VIGSGILIPCRLETLAFMHFPANGGLARIAHGASIRFALPILSGE